MALRDLESGDGWLPPTARLVRDSGELLFVPPNQGESEPEARAYAGEWFRRRFAPAKSAFAIRQREDLDSEEDADLIAQLGQCPPGTRVAFGVAYRDGFPPLPELDDPNDGESYRRRLHARSQSSP
ncbi:hypothetical protein ACFSKW_45735 [Nonomuraea mangrovi]|uniref:Uncharacterized protein n=1 Tax=Nonomuraea mangrovi TaxID=2316207 RepID=A0ABW4TDG7_9ACTN